MSLKPLSPQDARQYLSQGALLVDIRAAGEYAREHIAQARHIPMERMDANAAFLKAADTVIFYCHSGNRTRMNAQALSQCVNGKAYALEGGLNAWKKAGLAVKADASQPLELQRQVQIAAGSMIVLGMVLGITISPWFFILPAFVGAGLVFAGVSGFCGLAHVVIKMPWNQRALDTRMLPED